MSEWLRTLISEAAELELHFVRRSASIARSKVDVNICNKSPALTISRVLLTACPENSK